MDETVRSTPGTAVSSVALTPCAPELAAHRRLRLDCRYFLVLAGLAGVLYALCFVDAGGWGLNFPVYYSLWCVLAHLAVRRLGLADMRRELFWYGGIMALSVTVFWTANSFIQFVSAAGIWILQGFWALSLAADVRDWHFVKAVSAAVQLVFRSLRRCLEPLTHLAAVRTGGWRWKQVLLGLGLAFPMAMVAMALMMSADAAFRAMFSDLALPDFLWVGLRGVFWTLLVFDGFYALLCAQTAEPVGQGQPEARRFPTLVAVTFLTVLAAIYALFCAVQIRVLFFRGGGLPAGYTYAEYAREGFFQLLALSALNVGGVIVSQRRFESSRTLRTLLCLVSVCTYIMELSSAWRMALYVQAYGLTFWRLLVLWFLAVLSVILAGAMVTVFRPKFRLFFFSLVVCLAAWLIFAFARPDALAARYDLERFGPGENSLSAIRYDLSADAVGELGPYLETDRAALERWLDPYLRLAFPSACERAGLRGFNYSLWRAKCVSEEYVNGK